MGNFLDKRDKSLAPSFGGIVPPVDKVSKFNWSVPGPPGTFRLVNKQLLNLDDVYQRDKISDSTVRRIARSWDWTLFRVLSVAERPDRSLWVFDGGHRLRASFYRLDITELPCMVFPIANLKDEARAFIAGAIMTSPISAVDTWRASSIAEEPICVQTREILGRLGISVKKNATQQGDLKCIGTVRRIVATDPELAERVLATALAIAKDQPISGVVCGGLFEFAKHFAPRDVLGELVDALLELGQGEIEKAARQLKAECGKGGDVIEAKAIMHLLNKGKRSRKLQW